MSLVRLLTTGKSLVGGSESATRYRLTHRKALPKFGSARNPFRAKASRAAEQTETPMLSQRPPSVGQQPPAPVHQACQEAVETAQTRPEARLSRWIYRLAAWLFRTQPRKAKPAIPRFSKPPVQGELLLDQIKVVRNDLSDADLEIVPVKAPAPPVSAAPALTQGKRAETTSRAWGRMTTRLFGS
jgi:hypothetical protein